MNMLAQAMMLGLLVLPLLTQAAGTGGKQLYMGTAHFYSAGQVASPVAYRTIGVEVKIPRYENHHSDVKLGVREYLEQLREGITTKFGKNESDIIMARVERRIAPQLLRLDKATTDLLEFYGTAMIGERSAVLLGLAAAVGSVVAMGSALLSQHEIKEVSGEVRYLKGHVRGLSRDMKELKGGFKRMGKVAFEHYMEEELTMNITMLLEPFILDAIGKLEGVYALKGHRLHPALLGPSIMEEVHHELENMREGWHPVFDTKTELMNMPVSYIQGEHSLLILLHAPVVQDSRTMLRHLYRLDGAIMERQNRLVRLTTPTPYISVDGAWTTHQVMSGDDLQACMKVGKTHLCSGDNILLSKPTTCTAALFFGLSQMAADSCEAKTVEEEVPAIRLNGTTFAISPGPITTSCPGEEPKVMTLDRVTRVRVNKECSVTGDGFQITAGFDGDKPKVIDHQVLIPEVVVTDPTKMAKDLLMPDLSLDLFMGPRSKEDDGLDDDEWTDAEGGSEWMTIVLTVTCFLVLIAIVAAVWGTWARCRSSAGRQEQEADVALEMKDIEAGPTEPAAQPAGPATPVEQGNGTDALAAAPMQPSGPQRKGRQPRHQRGGARRTGHRQQGGAPRRRAICMARNGAKPRACKTKVRGLVRMTSAAMQPGPGVEVEVATADAPGAEDNVEKKESGEGTGVTFAGAEVVEDAPSTGRQRRKKRTEESEEEETE